MLVALLLLSVVFRLGGALYMGNGLEALPGTYDQVSYHNLALRVLSGEGFSFGKPWWPATAANAPTAHWSYLYTGWLVLVYALFGPQPLVARLIQAAIVGVLQPYLAFRLGRELFGALAGLAAAALTALYAYFVYYAGTLMTESFYLTAILAILWLAVRLAGRAGGRTWKAAIGMGLLLGAAVLLRQLFLLFIPFLWLWLLWAGGKRLAGAALVSAAVLAAVIMPVTAYNYARFDRFVLLNTNAGYAFFWGNHPIYGTRFVPILPSRTYQKLIPAELRGLDEAALDQALLRRGVGFVLEDPGRYALLSLSRIPSYFMFWPSGDSETLSNVARVGSFGVLWPFMLYGLWLSLARRAGGAASPAAWLLALFVAVYTAIHLLSWALIRYRLPVDSALLIFAGLAVKDLAERLPSLRRQLEGLA